MIFLLNYEWKSALMKTNIELFLISDLLPLNMLSSMQLLTTYYFRVISLTFYLNYPIFDEYDICLHGKKQCVFGHVIFKWTKLL